MEVKIDTECKLWWRHITHWKNANELLKLEENVFIPHWSKKLLTSQFSREDVF